MPTAHIEAEKNEIAKKVLMPGDPLRAKYIADNFLDNVRVVNRVRNMYAYTGTYKGVEVTIFPSGMGIPSIGIYAYELFNIYGVEEIIRIGTCGSSNEKMNLLDVVLATTSYSLSTFPKAFDGDDYKSIDSSFELNKKIMVASKENNISLKTGPIITSDIFDPYIDFNKYIKNYSSDIEYLAMEMEAYGLFYLAKKFNKRASSLLTVVDVIGKDASLTSSEREKSLNDMILVALEAILK